MKEHATGTLAVTLILALAAGCNGDNNGPGDLETEFAATLTGAAERPDPVTTTATGSATVTINDAAQTLTFSVTVSGLLNPTMAHIHVGSVSEAGPIVVNLLLTAPPAGTFNGVLATGARAAVDVTGGETFATLVAKIRAGNAYINVHTVANPNGELRGQLVAD